MRTRAVLLAAVLVVVVGCSDDDGDAGDTTTATTTAAADTTTATTRAPTTTDAPETTDADTTSSAESDTTDASDTTEADDTDASDATDDTTDDTTLEDRVALIEEALEDGDFSVMLEALNLSGLAEEIEDEEITVLAPTDDAFGELSVGDYADLLTDPDQLQDLIDRHVIEEVLTYEELSERSEVTMRSGDTFTVTVTGGVVEIDGIEVTELDADLDADEVQEAAVFSIDGVLLEGS
jgi:uncharacterized surface protein with fasciclin (FAS1) repeats